MSATSVQSPFPIFNDAAGNPLNDGYIYIGTANLNPETNPITVYWDAALTIPAAQPIRTTGGYPSRNGTPAALYVAASECSVLVRDKNLQLVFYGENLQQTISSAFITFIQSGVGAVAGNVQDQLRNFVFITQYGAVNGGVVDCLPAFLAAAVELLSRGGGIILVPPGRWRVSDAVQIDWPGITIVGSGYDSVIVCDLTATAAVRFGNISTSVVALQCGIKNIRVARAAGVIPAGSIGIDYQNFNYCFEADVFVEGHDINRRVTGSPTGISIGWECLRPLSRSAKTYHAQFAYAAGMKIFGGDIGNNAGDAYDCVAMVNITGNCNDVVLHGTNLMPRGPSVSKPHAISFTNYSGSGTFRFTDVDTENTHSLISSDAATTSIPDLIWVGGRVAPVASMLNLDPATQAYGWTIADTNISVSTVFRNPKWLKISGNKFGGNVELIGGATASAQMNDNMMLAGVNLTASGAWAPLEIDDVVFEGGGGLYNSATGTVSITEETTYSTSLAVSAQSGTFTSASADGEFNRRGRTVFFDILITITTNGTAAGWIYVSLPSRYGNSTSKSVVTGYHSTGELEFGMIDSGTSVITVIRKYDSTYLGGDGTTIALSGKYNVV
jgi:hypothetical protein